MDDLMSKLQNVLNDKESMKQIGELADMLTGGSKGGGDTGSEEKSRGSSPMPDLSELFSGKGEKSESPPLPDFDINKLLKLRGIMAQAGSSDKNVDLLLALRPLLKEENQVKIDRLVKIFRLIAIYPALKESGLLGGDLFGLL